MAVNKVEICGVNTSQLPVLSNKEKLEPFHRIKQGDTGARDKFVEGNLRLVLSVIKRFASRGENVDDLFQVGCVGLINAIDNFDLSQKCAIQYLCGANDYRGNTPVSAGQQFHPCQPALFGILLINLCKSKNG